jgi:hypothetical protein
MEIIKFLSPLTNELTNYMQQTLLEKLTVPHLFDKIPLNFVEPEGLLPY